MVDDRQEKLNRSGMKSMKLNHGAYTSGQFRNKSVFEFHIARQVRDFYQFDEVLYAQTGNVVLINFYMVRLFADKMNRKRDLISFPEQAVKAGQLNAMGLIDEILHYVSELYREKLHVNTFHEAINWLESKIDRQELDRTLLQFVTDFPPVAVYKNQITAGDYLQASSAGVPNREIVLEELLLLYLANTNPAFDPFKELFNDSTLNKETPYHLIINGLANFFKEQPFFGPENQSLFEMLRTPAARFPHSLTAQLEFILRQWGAFLSKFILRLFGSLDMIKEEEKAFFGGAGPTILIDYWKLLALEEDWERFSSDLDWMPKVVTIAKSVYVWMDQLSKKYMRSISKLNEIPNEELELLARRGFNSLWLIGVWERSPASQKIKQLCGNPEAVSSAYSLFDYEIANDLGGVGALQDLRHRAWQRGIRLASDMVPNHSGIYSKWAVEHPDWFIQTSYPIYPKYSFNGPNLSTDERVGIYIEDGYWNRTDAAVQFKRVDHYTGETRYIYHGNDGTSMPWNDTAQLNYLKAEVREAVIQTILHVARQFSIIRLDAAMTLTRRHYQRLWFPQPGSGGDIPSRAEFSMTREMFNEVMPDEFWRQVVDRVAAEVPDTLLLAEAFWLMEGYFVRTLGMHRVYNSAFMNMLKNEENQKYRQSIKNVMDFNPEIMKRYVNFMNNPDEETAVAQFGKGDKYFGVCILMSTLPGLPMFGHGQIEGLAEKYGMEYKRAYWNEQEDVYLIERHEREIFPILKKRYLFCEVQNFVLYDFYNTDGHVNEDVYAFSNRTGEERALVLYNNKYERARGWIKYSCATSQKVDGNFVQVNLLEGLNLVNHDRFYTIFRDQISGLEFIRNNRQLYEQGLYAELDGFRYQVFLHFRQVEDNLYHHYAQLTGYLNGRGVPSIETALKETFLSPVHQAFRELIASDFLKECEIEIEEPALKILVKKYESNLNRFLSEIKKYSGSSGDDQALKDDITRMFTYLIHIQQIDTFFGITENTALKFLQDKSPQLPILIIWLSVFDLGCLQDENYRELISLSWLDEFLLIKLISQSLGEISLDEQEVWHRLRLIRTLTSIPFWLEKSEQNLPAAVETLFQYQEVRDFLQVNRYQDILYFNKECFEELIAAFYTCAIARLVKPGEPDLITLDRKITDLYEIVHFLLEKVHEAGYRIDKLQELVS
jgi:glycosidase